MLMTCSPRAVHEAENVVAQADSLWRAGQMYGREAGDSATLAQAYETLGQWQWFYADEYAHACYHYGRLLRELENPAAAMECFINATHTRTRDYHILGRVYSNIGSICHLAGEFPLSYDMYERSANCFLTDNDSLSYYFLLNDMAYELAEQGKKDSAFMVLEQIDRTKIDSYAIMKIFETKAEACLYAHMYDSAIYYTSPLLSYSYVEPEWLLIRAQAYSLNGENDSAVYYANRALSITNEIYHQNNALYILTNNDTTIDIEAVRVVAADRADVQKLIEIKRSKCAQAVQYLEQNLNAERNITWLYAIIATVIIIGGGISVYVYCKRRKHKLISQKVEDLQQAASKLQEKHDDLSKRYIINQKRLIEDIENKCATLHNNKNLTKELSWSNYDTMCSIMDEQFYLFATKLRKKQILNETETRLCVLVLLDLNRAEISSTLPYAHNSVGKLKDHTAKLLGTKGKNLREFLLKMAIEG